MAKLPPKKLIVLSLGGSLIVPKEGFDIPFLQEFKKFILKYLEKNYHFVIVCGGGSTCRVYQDAVRGVSELEDEDIDWLGIHTTRLNAHFMRTIFRKWAYPVVTKNPTKKMRWETGVLIGAGWKPGWSTDYVAVKLAKLYGAKTVINLSNIDYAYDKDPKVFKDAKKIKDIKWKEFRKIVGDKWVPGSNLPFDPIASQEAEKDKIKVIILKGNNLKQIGNALDGNPYQGTTVS